MSRTVLPLSLQSSLSTTSPLPSNSLLLSSNLLLHPKSNLRSRIKRNSAVDNDDEVAERNTSSTDTNRLIVTSDGGEKAPKPSLTDRIEKKKLSRKDEKKLEKLQQVKETKSKLNHIYSTLARHRLNTSSQLLLRSSGEIGKKSTLRERLRQAYREEKAGIRIEEEKNITVLKHHSDKSLLHSLSKQEAKSLLKRKRNKRDYSDKIPIDLSSTNISDNNHDSFGLLNGRWSNTARGEGYINIDTNRTITYETEDEDEDKEGDESLDDENDKDDENIEAEAEFVSENKVDNDIINDQKELNTKEEIDDADINLSISSASNRDQNRSSLNLPSVEHSNIGMFSIPFPVIATSNRPPRKRRLLILPNQQQYHQTHLKEEEKEQEKETENETEKEIQEGEAITNLSKAVTSTPSAEMEMSSTDQSKLESGKITFSAVNNTPVQVMINNGMNNYNTISSNVTRYIPSQTSPVLSSNEVFQEEERCNDGEVISAQFKKGEAIIDTSLRNTVDKSPFLYSRIVIKPFSLPTITTHSNRLPNLNQARLSLPIVSYEQEIIDNTYNHLVILLAGETGSGKTTQLPQYLIENGWGVKLNANGYRIWSGKEGMIGITQPRRVAAISTCQRVAEEMNLPMLTSNKKNYQFNQSKQDEKRKKEIEESDRLNHIHTDGIIQSHYPYNTIIYQIRYSSPPSLSPTGSDPLMKFMTDGILLREIQKDFILRKYSVICIDEAHERGRNTDLLIGLISRIVIVRSRLYEESYKRWKSWSDERVNYSLVECERREKLFDSDPQFVRSPLKLIIMSATLRLADFNENSNLFPSPPPTIIIPTRNHPITIHYSAKTPTNTLEGVFHRLMQMHIKLPSGGILVFLTGKDEIEWIMSKIEEEWKKRQTQQKRLTFPPKSIYQQENEVTETQLQRKKENPDIINNDADLNNFNMISKSIYELDEEAENAEELGATKTSIESDDSDVNTNPSLHHPSTSSPSTLSPYCLPLYSLLPTHLQMRVFSPPPPGTRLIVLSTNIAETSLTIPSIRYVLDSGKEKKKLISSSGVTKYEIDWICRASSDQRAGRAGRIGAGHVYRMYSTSVYHNRLEEYATPEILTEPIESTILIMKSLQIKQIKHFPFPTPPSEESIKQAIKTLQLLNAIDNTVNQAITPLGYTISRFPVDVRYAKILSLAHQGGCLSYMIAIVSALTVGQIFNKVKLKDMKRNQTKSHMLALGTKAEDSIYEDDSTNNNNDNNSDVDSTSDIEFNNDELNSSSSKSALFTALMSARYRWRHEDSDLLTYLRLIGGYEYTTRESILNYNKLHFRDSTNILNKMSKSCEEYVKKSQEKFCIDNFVRFKAMQEIQLLRQQLTNIARQINDREKMTNEATIPKLQKNKRGKKKAEEYEQFEESEDESYDGIEREILSESHSQTSPFPYLVPPTAIQEKLIRQLLLSGLIDRVAKKMNEDEKQKWKEKNPDSDLNLSGAYLGLAVDDPVFIHPSSTLFPPTNQPEFLMYHSIIHSSSIIRPKLFLFDNTAVQIEWLADIGSITGLTKWSTWLNEPKPVWYPTHHGQSGEIRGWKKGEFGPKRWPIPMQLRTWHEQSYSASSTSTNASSLLSSSYSLPNTIYSHFARLLLSGEIYPSIARFLPYLTFKPIHLIEEGHKVKEIYFSIVLQCRRWEIVRRERLREIWSKEQTFLLEQLKPWCNKTKQQEFMSEWRQIIQEEIREINE